MLILIGNLRNCNPGMDHHVVAGLQIPQQLNGDLPLCAGSVNYGGTIRNSDHFRR